jgi:hypothetical protein
MIQKSLTFCFVQIATMVITNQLQAQPSLTAKSAQNLDAASACLAVTKPTIVNY